MTIFDKQSFNREVFSKEQIKQYLASALKDLKIAETSDYPEVVFKFSYDALIKIGLSLIANAGYKVRSKTGHHIKILEKLSAMLGDENIVILGNKMRQDRNIDLYGGGYIMNEKESGEYLDFVKSVYNQASHLI